MPVRGFIAIWKRELGSCFLSPVAYVTMTVFLAATGVTFVAALVRHAGTAESATSLLAAAVVLWLSFLIAVVAMRLFAEESRAGTLETLLTAPVTDTQVVLGKFAGALSFLLIAVLPCLAFMPILVVMNPAMTSIDAGALGATALILLLLSAFCVSIGLLASLLTRNQIVAAVCCLCGVWAVLLLGTIVSSLPFGLDGLARYLGAMEHMEMFSRGIIDTRPIVLYLSATAFVLFVSVRVLEWRRWS